MKKKEESTKLSIDKSLHLKLKKWCLNNCMTMGEATALAIKQFLKK